MTEQTHVSRRPCYPPSCHSSALGFLWLISRPSHVARLPSNEVLHRNFEHQPSPVSALRGRPDLPATNFSLSASPIATHPYLWPWWGEFVVLLMWLTRKITTWIVISIMAGYLFRTSVKVNKDVSELGYALSLENSGLEHYQTPFKHSYIFIEHCRHNLKFQRALLLLVL